MRTGDKTFRNLDLLRGVAVLCVFVSHIIQYLTNWKSWSLGHGGVLLFFVHTSLVLMYSLERQGESRLWQRFMLRRIFRIFPLSILAVLTYISLQIPSIVYYHTAIFEHLSAADLISNLTLTQNLFSIESVPAALWSLPYELQMYLLLPLVFLVMRKSSSIDAISIWLVSVALSALVMAVAPRPFASFFQYVPCFMSGPFAYALRNHPKIFPYWFFPATLALFVGLYCAAPADFVAVQWPLCIGLGYVLASTRQIPSGVISVAAAWIAKYSFGIYLFHMVSLVLFLPRFGVAGIVPSTLFTALIAWVAYIAVEHPFISLGNIVSGRLATAPLIAKGAAQSAP
ncbi:MAG: acyltransferase family protein [Acidobacteriaceae bacterium]